MMLISLSWHVITFVGVSIFQFFNNVVVSFSLGLQPNDFLATLSTKQHCELLLRFTQICVSVCVCVCALCACLLEMRHMYKDIQASV